MPAASALAALLGAALALRAAAHGDASRSHACAHGAAPAAAAHDWVTAPGGAAASSRRRLGAASWGPIRINVRYPESMAQQPFMDATKADFVRKQLLPSVVDEASRLLHVRRVPGQLYAHRECDGSWYLPTDGSPAVCTRFKAATTCSAVASDEATITFGSELGEDVLWQDGKAVTLPAGLGVPNTDFVLYVTARHTGTCGQCVNGDVIAYARHACQRDDIDRPTFARLNLCPCQLSAADETVDYMKNIVLHELVHALGFTAKDFVLYRRRDDLTPRTPRDARFPGLPAPQYRISFPCPGRSGAMVERWMPHPSAGRYVSERGMGACRWSGDPATSVLPWATANLSLSDCVFKAFTPAAVSVARDFFGCPAEEVPEFGLELENHGEEQDCALFGSHVEQRILRADLMASQLHYSAIVSPAALALLEDSGWYRLDWNRTQPLAKGLVFGYQQGCAFATQKCSPSNVGAPQHWYFDAPAASVGLGNAICTVRHDAVGRTLNSANLALPPQYRYWPDPTMGDNSAGGLNDFCPTVQREVAYRCNVAEDGPITAAYGETFGNSSRCLRSSLVGRGTGARVQGAACYGVSCSADRRTYNVTVAAPNATGAVAAQTVRCSAAGQTAQLAGYDGVIECADPAFICAAPAAYGGPAPYLDVAPPEPPSLTPGQAAGIGIGVACAGILLVSALLIAFKCGRGSAPTSAASGADIGSGLPGKGGAATDGALLLRQPAAAAPLASQV